MYQILLAPLMERKSQRILVTGAAGFIGFHLTRKLLELGYIVVGVDNINSYYDVDLKFDRLQQLGINKKQAEIFGRSVESTLYDQFQFYRLDLEDREHLPNIFQANGFDTVINLAAQAGVRYSIEHPAEYIDSNLVGFANLLECCRHEAVEHLIFASSSSVYGESNKVPFSVEDNVDQPISLYAATKKSNELMAHTYSHLYRFKTTGLRFFTVYGPWGRPDMAIFLFTEAIKQGKPINIFNNGNLERDFTFIDDVVDGLIKVLLQDRGNPDEFYKLYNIGNSRPVPLLDFVEEIEKCLQRQAIKNMLPMQAGDVSRTWSDISPLQQDFGYKPRVNIEEGIKAFVDWYNEYYK